jgi:hypothetical protein
MPELGSFTIHTGILSDSEILLWLIHDLPEKVEIPFDELWDYLNDRLYFEVPSNRKELDWMEYVENLKGFIDSVYGDRPNVNRIDVMKTLADWVYYRVT